MFLEREVVYETKRTYEWGRGMRLSQLTTLKVNNKECVILEVRPDRFAELIALGCFNGNEKLIRVTKGSKHTFTIWTEGGKSYSWSWGNGYTIVSDEMHKRRALIMEAITKDFGIDID